MTGPNKIRLIKSTESRSLEESSREQMIAEAAVAYGNFLTALGFDWQNDPHMENTPTRVAKAWINDLAEGCYASEPKITSFPNTEGYTGLVAQCNIPVTSMCAHHNLPFTGKAHVAYIPSIDGKVVGLSKLNRIVEWFARRPSIQESLTQQIHSYISDKCEANSGVAVVIESQHQCVGCRGVRHDSTMATAKLSGFFFDNEIGTRTEFYNLINTLRK